MQKQIDKIYLSNEKRNKYEVKVLYEKCTALGIKLPDDFLEKYDGSKYLYNYIKKDENNKKYFNENSWADNNVFYREYMSYPNTDFFLIWMIFYLIFQRYAKLHMLQEELYFYHIYMNILNTLSFN